MVIEVLPRGCCAAKPSDPAAHYGEEYRRGPISRLIEINRAKGLRSPRQSSNGASRVSNCRLISLDEEEWCDEGQAART